MTETLHVPHPGSRLDAVAVAAAHESPAEPPAASEASVTPLVVATRSDMPEETIPRTLVLGSANPYLPILPRDMQRRRAVLIPLANAVILCETKELAQQAASAASSTGTGSATAQGSAADPGAFGAIAFTSTLPAGTYTVTVTVFLSGTVTAADGSNMELVYGGANPVVLAYPGVANVPVTTTVTVTLTSPHTIGVQAINAASGASAIYNASIVATGTSSTPAGLASGAYIPAGTPVSLESRDWMYAAVTTTATVSPVTVIAERYAQPAAD